MKKTMRVSSVTPAMFARVTKAASASGKSRSAFVRDLIEAGLEGTTMKESVPVSGISLETVMEAVKSEGSGVPPEVLRFLVADVAKTENLLRQISLLLSPGNFKEHEERIRIAEKKSERILKSLRLSDIEDVDRIETGNVLNCVQKVLEIEKGHGKKVCVDQNTDLHPLGGNHDPWQEV